MDPERTPRRQEPHPTRTGMNSETARSRGEARQAGADATPWLEWIASGIGLVLALGTLGVIAAEMLTGGRPIPAVIVHLDGVVETPAGFVALVTARNPADATAAKVEIEGELRQGDDVLETSRIQFDYVPARSERRGGLYFRHDPRQYRLEARALGYSEP
jgi:uncharacterized protein (TIGR02588 family)